MGLRVSIAVVVTGLFNWSTPINRQGVTCGREHPLGDVLVHDGSRGGAGPAPQRGRGRAQHGALHQAAPPSGSARLRPRTGRAAAQLPKPAPSMWPGGSAGRGGELEARGPHRCWSVCGAGRAGYGGGGGPRAVRRCSGPAAEQIRTEPPSWRSCCSTGCGQSPVLSACSPSGLRRAPAGDPASQPVVDGAQY